jgi:hypothetical protein
MDRPCKHPEEARLSIEISGIDFLATMYSAGHEIEVLRCMDEEYVLFGMT